MLNEEVHFIDHGKHIFVSYRDGFFIFITVKTTMIMIHTSA